MIIRAVLVISSTGLRALLARKSPPRLATTSAEGTVIHRMRSKVLRASSTASREVATWTILMICRRRTTGTVTILRGYFPMAFVVSKVALPWDAFLRARMVTGS